MMQQKTQETEMKVSGKTHGDQKKPQETKENHKIEQQKTVD